MTDEEEDHLLDALAVQEHASWARWMAYLLHKFPLNADGSLTFPAAYVQALQRQVDTPYSALTPSEQQADRDEAAYHLPTIRQYAEDYTLAQSLLAETIVFHPTVAETAATFQVTSVQKGTPTFLPDPEMCCPG